MQFFFAGGSLSIIVRDATLIFTSWSLDLSANPGYERISTIYWCWVRYRPSSTKYFHLAQIVSKGHSTVLSSSCSEGWRGTWWISWAWTSCYTSFAVKWVLWSEAMLYRIPWQWISHSTSPKFGQKYCVQEKQTHTGLSILVRMC